LGFLPNTVSNNVESNDDAQTEDAPPLESSVCDDDESCQPGSVYVSCYGFRYWTEV